MYGTIRFINVQRGFAFLNEDGKEGREHDVFLHYTNFIDKVAFDLRLVGRRVRFDLAPSAFANKPPQAVRVVLLPQDDSERDGGLDALGGAR
jgi:cold shock CspA family protein